MVFIYIQRTYADKTLVYNKREHIMAKLRCIEINYLVTRANDFGTAVFYYV